MCLFFFEQVVSGINKGSNCGYHMYVAPFSYLCRSLYKSLFINFISWHKHLYYLMLKYTFICKINLSHVLIIILSYEHDDDSISLEFEVNLVWFAQYFFLLNLCL